MNYLDALKSYNYNQLNKKNKNNIKLLTEAVPAKTPQQVINRIQAMVVGELSSFDIIIKQGKTDLKKLSSILKNIKATEKSLLLRAAETSKNIGGTKAEIEKRTRYFNNYIRQQFGDVKKDISSSIEKLKTKSIGKVVKKVGKSGTTKKVVNKRLRIRIGNTEVIDIPSKHLKISNKTLKTLGKGVLVVSATVLAGLIIAASYIAYRDMKKDREEYYNRMKMEDAEKKAREEALQKQISVLYQGGNENLKYSEDPEKTRNIILAKIKELSGRRFRVINSMTKG